MSASINTVVWDLGGVLIDWDPRYLYRQLLAGDDEVEAFLAEVDFDVWNAEQDAGRPFAAAVVAHAERFPHRRELLAAYPARFAETLRGEVDGSLALLADLRRAGVRQLALTNWPAELFWHARERFRWLDWFEAVTVSGEERLAKPDPRLFQLVVDRYRLDPARTAYVDDNPRNVAAAAALGLRALRFVGADTLRADLVQLGLLPSGAA